VAGHRHSASRPCPTDRLSVCDRAEVGVGAFRPAAGVAGDVWRIGVAGVCVWGGRLERERERGRRAVYILDAYTGYGL